MDYSAKFKTETTQQLANPTEVETNFQKQNDLIFILDQDLTSVAAEKANPLKQIFNSLGFNNDVKLHLGVKCRTAQGGIYMTIGNSYLSFKNPAKQSDNVYIQNINVKTFTNGDTVKKGFTLNFNSTPKKLEDHEVDDELSLDHDSNAFKNQFLIKMQNNQKMRIEATLSNGERFFSNHFSKRQIEDYTLVVKN